MSYEPTNWKSGDTVTSAKLNKMEQGIANAGGGALVVNVTETEDAGRYYYTCDKTAQEILAALEIGVVVFKYDFGAIENCIGGGPFLDGYKFFRGGVANDSPQFTAQELTDYPSFVD